MTASKLQMTCYDARPDWMKRFVHILEAYGGRRIEPTEGWAEVEQAGGDRFNIRADLTYMASVPEDAEIGYYVVSAPVEGYMRCVMFAAEEDTFLMQLAIRDTCEVNFSTIVEIARREGATLVPPLLAERGVAAMPEPVVLHGDLDEGGMSAVCEWLMDPDEDITPERHRYPLTVFRKGGLIVLTLTFEIHSLDPFAAMMAFGSPGALARLRSAHADGERCGRTRPDRRAEAQKVLARAAWDTATARFSGGAGRA